MLEVVTAAVHDRIIVVVRVNNVIVWLTLELLAGERDEAMARGAFGWTLGLSFKSESWTALRRLTCAVDLEVALRVEAGVLGRGAGPGVVLEPLTLAMVDLVPFAHVSFRLEAHRERWDVVANYFFV